jgi:holin-like protein
LLASPRLMKKIEESGHRVLKHMSLFFIPAGVGIMVSASGIAQHWLALLLAIVISTLLTLAVTAASMRIFLGPNGDHADSAQDTASQSVPSESDK